MPTKPLFELPEPEKPQVVNINDLQDYRSAKDNEKKLQELYEEMGIHKAEEDDESQAIADLILEQQGILEDYRKQFDMEELKFLSSNIDYLLKTNNLRAADLEDILRVSPGYISRTMGPKAKKRLSVDVLVQIAEVFHVNINELVNRDYTAPVKSVSRVFSFLLRLIQQTENGSLHWRSIGKTITKDNDMYLLPTEEGMIRFVGSEETESYIIADEVYEAKAQIGYFYLCPVRDMFSNEVEYEIYVFDDEDYNSRLGSGYENQKPFVGMCYTAKDGSRLLRAKADELYKLAVAHKVDYVISEEAEKYMNLYMDEVDGVLGDDLPFK